MLSQETAGLLHLVNILVWWWILPGVMVIRLLRIPHRG